MSGPSSTALREGLEQAWNPVRQLGSVQSLLAWDQETYLPRGGHAARADQLSALAGIAHERLCGSELEDAVQAVLESDAAGPRLEAHALQARRKIDRATRLPKELAQALAAAVPTATAAWQQARSDDRLEPFDRELGNMLRLKREEAAAIGGAEHYDALLDEFEPGATVEQLDPLFEALREDVRSLMAQVAAAPPVDESAARGDFPEDTQVAFGSWIAEKVGFAFDRGRLDPSAHPFCVGIHPSDVRLTWRARRDDLRPGLFGVLHEMGHGLYEQGLPPEDTRLPGCEAVSLGVHESQSRIWENQAGRSRGFWEGVLPRFQSTFGTDTDVDQLWPALHAIRPSLIRVDADEVSYLLHIEIRYTLERALLRGELELHELEEAWNRAYEDRLGVTPRRLDEGLLQDIHWANGLFGYFPTYALGSMLAHQLFEAAERELGPLESSFAQLDFAGLLGWLRDRVHRHGATKSADQITRDATGQSLAPTALLDTAKARVETLYHC